MRVDPHIVILDVWYTARHALGRFFKIEVK